MSSDTRTEAPERLPWWQRTAVILAAALLLRLVLVLPALDTTPYHDEDSYHSLAAALAAGEGYRWPTGAVTSRYPPLWPAAMALVYTVAGPEPAAARLLQVVLGAVLVALLMALAGAVAPEAPRARWIVGWWATLSPTLIVFSHGLWSETSFAVLFAGALLALLRGQADGRTAPFAAAGLLLGLAALTRATTLLFVPPALIWVALTHPAGRRRGVRPALLAGGLCALVILPWAVRNTVVHQAPVLIDTNAATNLYEGNHARTPLLRAWEVVEPDNRPLYDLPDDEMAAQREATRAVVAYVREHPGRFVGGWFLKAGNLWGLARDLPGALGAGLYGTVPTGAIVLAAAVSAAEGLALLVLAVLGLAVARRRPAVELAILIAVYLTLAHMVSYGHSRYRFGFYTVAYPFAALAVAQGRAAWAETPPGRRRGALGVAGLLVLNVLYEVIVLELLPRLG